MKRLSMPGVFLFIVLPALVSAQQMTPQSPVTSSPPTASVAETTWAGTDSDGDYTEYYFQANGALHYKTPTGFWKNGTWKQDGDAIYMETNKKYTELEGRIDGGRMAGSARNVRGRRWTWIADKR